MRGNIDAPAMLVTSESVTKERRFFRMDSISPKSPQDNPRKKIVVGADGQARLITIYPESYWSGSVTTDLTLPEVTEPLDVEDDLKPAKPVLSGKPCSICGERLRIKHQSYCRECCNARRKGYYKKNYKPGQNKERFLLKRFNLTQKQYDAMLKQQKGVCAICGEHEIDVDHRTGKVRALAVDHNHATGEIRALLCRKCNWIVGNIESEDERYRKALAYVQRHETVIYIDLRNC